MSGQFSVLISTEIYWGPPYSAKFWQQNLILLMVSTYSQNLLLQTFYECYSVYKCMVEDLNHLLSTNFEKVQSRGIHI